MAVRPILRIGDPRLRQVSDPVDDFDTPELHELIRDYQQMCSAEFDRCGGQIANYIGDGLRDAFDPHKIL